MPDGTSSTRHLRLLAPALVSVPPTFTQAVLDREAHANHLAQLQRVRGRIYLEDGAIEPWQLTADGRHHLNTDEKSWHVLTMEADEVVACARVQVYSPLTTMFSDLGVSASAQARCPEWGSKLERAVTADLRRAQNENLSYAEAGGWALEAELRCTTEALNIALASYALGQLLGGCLGLSTATVRHHSSSILRRLGGSTLQWDGQAIPPYFDPQYQCEMQIVSFDSRRVNPKYQFWVDQLVTDLPAVRVFCLDEGVVPSRGLTALAKAVSSPATVRQPCTQA